MLVATRSFVRRPALACTGAAALAAILYLNALANPFVYDDHRMVVENTGIQDLADLRAIVLLEPTRPLVNFSYAVDYAVWGLNPFGFHLTNLLLHVLNVVLLFLVARRLVEDRARTGLGAGANDSGVAALAAALVFAAHPMMTQAVGYIAGRPELLCGAFFLLALVSARRWMLGGNGWWWALSALGWLAALASKEIAAMFPFVLLLYERLILRLPGPLRRRADLGMHAVFLGVGLVAVAIRVGVLIWVEHPGEIAIGWPFLVLQFDLVLRYLALLVAPTGQTIFHAVPAANLDEPRTWMAIGAVALMVGAAIRLRREAAPASLGLFWFLLLLAPSAALVVFDRAEPMAEHRIYVASMGLFLAVGAGIGAAFGRLHDAHLPLRLLVLAACAVVLVSLSARTVIRNVVWRSPVGLWAEAVEQAPDHWFPLLLLGEALHGAGRNEEAIAAYTRVIELRPEDPAAYQKLALGYAESGRYREAQATFERFRRLDARSPIPSNGLGAIALLTGDRDQARAHFLEALVLDPPNVRARQALAAIAEQEPASFVDALRLCQEIQQLAPRTPGNDDCIRRNQVRVAAGR